MTIICCLSFCFMVAQTSSPIGEGRGEAFTLSQLLDSARSNNIALRNADRSIRSAYEQRKEAFTKYFPTISGSAFWFDAAKDIISTDVTIPGVGSLPLNYIKDGVHGSVSATQPIFAGGKIVNNNKLAKVSEESSQIQRRLSQNDVDKTAEAYFWQMVTIEEKLKTVAATEKLLNDIHKDVDISVKAGVSLRNDLLQVQLRQNEVESQKLKLNNGLSLVKMLIAQYCGLRDTSFVLSYDSKASSPIDLKQDHKRVLPNTAEYQLLGKQVEAAKLEKKLAVGQYLPTVAVSAGYSYSDILRSKSNANIMATVSVPISDWWGGSHAIKRKNIAYQQAIDQQQDQSQLLVIRMQNAWNTVEEAYKQLGIAEKSIEQSAENLRLHRDFYKAGTATMSDLLEAQMLYQQSQDSRTDAFADYQNSILAYKQAVGE